MMRTVAALFLILATIGWIIVAQAALFPALESFEYTLVDGIVVATIYLVAPATIIGGWSLFLQRRLPTRNQMWKAAAGAFAVVLTLWLYAVTIGA